MFEKVTGFVSKSKQKVKDISAIANNAQEVGNYTLIIHAHIKSAITQLQRLGVTVIKLLNSPEFNLKKDSKKYFSVLNDLKLYYSHMINPGKLRQYNLDCFLLYEELLETLKEYDQDEIVVKYKGNHALAIDDELTSIREMIVKERQVVQL